MPEVKPLQLRVTLEGKPDPNLNVQVYAFTRDGKFLTMAPLDKEGKSKLQLGPEQLAGARLFIGPAPGEGNTPTLRLMERMHAYQPAMKFDLTRREFGPFVIPDVIWHLWCPAFSHVHGRVVRHVPVGGTVQHWPVCHARVHICEVDRLPLILPKLPESIILKLRDELLHLIDIRWPRPPIPDPGPDPRWVIDPELPNLAEPVKVSPRLEKLTVPVDEKLVRQPLAAMAPALQPMLLSASAQVVRKALIDNVALIIPYLCNFRWFWPYITTCDEVAVVETDHDGRFEANIFYWACLDKPDLYFWVEYCIGGAWTTVQRRPVPCATYWNYVSGTEITIELNDDRVPWCQQPEIIDGKKVAVLTVGDQVSVSQLQHNAADAAHYGLTKDGQPLGGSLEPHLWFGRTLVDGAYKYRWSYRRLNNLLVPVDGWHLLDTPVIRHYGLILPDDRLVFKPDLMGPVDGELFRVQPEHAPEGGIWAPAVNSRLNAASAFFRSDAASLPAGKYQLKLEIFTNAGVQADDVEFHVPKADIAAPFTATVETIPAPAHNILMEGGHKAFVMILHVDNRPCVADIYPVEVDGSTSPTCGFLTYVPGSSKVKLQFRAEQPGGFATFTLKVTRGSGNVVRSVDNKPVTETTVSLFGGPTGDLTRAVPSYIFTAQPDVAPLVGTCTEAALAVTLGVDATATDGFDRLSYLDRDAEPEAFALVPKKPTA